MPIRLMSLSDYDAVLALWQASPGVGLSDADSPQAIARFLERNPGLCFVAEEEGRLAGAAQLDVELPEGADVRALFDNWAPSQAVPEST
mgnify:CR=1 FL=1